jgi:hypothetical protein
MRVSVFGNSRRKRGRRETKFGRQNTLFGNLRERLFGTLDLNFLDELRRITPDTNSYSAGAGGLPEEAGF